jgi:hypothetical protein
MTHCILHDLNYLAVLVASAVFFVLGSMWFSGILFGSVWVKELEHHKVTFKKPTQRDLLMKMLLTFIANFFACVGMACLVTMTDSSTATSGFWLGVLASAGFVLPAIASVFIWEGRSLTLFLIDSGYPTVGVILAGIILSLWR